MAGMMFVLTIPTECAENKLKTMPKIVITNEHLIHSSSAVNSPHSFENKNSPSRSRKVVSSEEVSPTPLLRIGRASKGYRHLEADEPVEINSSPIIIGDPNFTQKPCEKMVSSAKMSNSTDSNSADCVLGIARDSSMEAVMNELLKKFCIVNVLWQMSRDGSSHQITFSVESDHRYKHILLTLDEWGIGHRNGSSVSVIPCAVYNCSPTQQCDENHPKDFCEEWILSQKQSTWERFLSSIRARLNVAQIVHAVKEDAALTFDFVTLIIVASAMAAFGLVENSTILLVSSMLISPLMGPIIAIIFGIVIEDRTLIRYGWINEMFGILGATTSGFFFGLIVYSLNFYSSESGDGLVTAEMVSRCEIHSLIVGILTALPSGAAVAIAILSENIGSLVGVAISASILPPAVNTGIFWSMAALHSLGTIDNSTVIKSTYYSENQAIELAIHGSLSLLLTVVNIVCILLMGVLVLMIKEVAPTKHHQQFWKHDIKLARSFNQTHDIAEDEFTQKLADEMNQMQQTEDYTARLLRNINRKSYQNTWSPSGRNSRMVHTNSRDRRPSLTDLENMYAHLSATPSKSERLRAIPRYGSNAKKTFTSKSLSPAPYRTLNDAKSMPRKSKGRHALAVPVRMRASDANHMQNISEHNQTASSTFETVPNASACHSDDNASAKSANTVTSVNSNSVRSIRRFTVTPTIEPF